MDGYNQIESLVFKSEDPLQFRVPEWISYVFDIRATTQNGKFIDIEMQKANHPYFIDRALLYNAFLTIKARKELDGRQEILQLSKEEKDARRYEIPEIVSIWICNFKRNEFLDEYHDEWNLYSKLSLKQGSLSPVTPKMKYIILELPKFAKTLAEVKSKEDEWLYTIVNAANSKELPDFGEDSLAKAKERIRVDKVDDQLLVKQVKDMVTQDEIDCRIAAGILDGKAKGLAEGRAEGDRDARASMAKKLLKQGVPLNIIASASGFTEEEIKKI